MKRLFMFVFAAAVPTALQAAQLQVELKTNAGQPVQDAVVTFKPAQGGAAGPFRSNVPLMVEQHNIAFNPHVLIVPLGAEVTFPNRDKVRHHVYSFSPAKRFELKLYGREEARSVRFDKPGVVALGCNIHDRMSGYIVVVDTPYAAKSDAEGRAKLSDLPDGPGVLTVWQSQLKAPDDTLSKPLRLAGDTQQTLSLDLRPAMTMSMP